MNVSSVNVSVAPVDVKREEILDDEATGFVTEADSDGRTEMVPEEKEVDSDSGVCVPSASVMEREVSVDA